MANASQQTELEALRARVKALEQENDELLRERPAGASAASIDPRGPCCLMVGLTTLDIHACPVPRIPEGGGVEFVEEIHLSLAGTAGGTASTAASLGVPVRLVAALGDDEKAELLRQLMGRAGILCDALQSAEGYATSATVINVRPNGDRPCLHAFGASDQLSLSDAEAGRLAALAAAQVESHGTAIVHVGGTGLREGCPQEGSVLRLLRSLRAACCPEPEASAAAAGPSPLVVTMDLIAPHGGTLGLLASLLPMVDYFMPSLEEAEAITGCEGPGGCARRFLELGVRRAVVLKAGASGSYYVGAACQGDSSAGEHQAAADDAAGPAQQPMHSKCKGRGREGGDSTCVCVCVCVEGR